MSRSSPPRIGRRCEPLESAPEAPLNAGKRLAIERMASLLGWDALHYDTYPHDKFNIWHFPTEYRADPATREIRVPRMIPFITPNDLDRHRERHVRQAGRYTLRCSAGRIAACLEASLLRSGADWCRLRRDRARELAELCRASLSTSTPRPLSPEVHRGSPRPSAGLQVVRERSHVRPPGLGGRDRQRVLQRLLDSVCGQRVAQLGGPGNEGVVQGAVPFGPSALDTKRIVTNRHGPTRYRALSVAIRRCRSQVIMSNTAGE